MDDNATKKIRDDLIMFKNETLKDIKQTERALLEKYRNTEYSLNEKIENLKKQFKLFNDKIIRNNISFRFVKRNNE